MIQLFERFNTQELEFNKVSLGTESVILPKDGPYFQLPWIELNSYGIPKLSKYFPADKDRMFIQIPVQNELLEKFEELDKHMNSKQTDIFGHQLFTYLPLVKEGNRGKYIKVKLQTNFDSGDIETIIVQNGETIFAKELVEFEKYIKNKTKIKTIFKISKVWLMNKKYGVTLKLLKIAVEEPKQETIDLEALDFIMD